MSNDNENEAENERRAHILDIIKPLLRHGQKYTRYEMCLSILMAVCLKQHVSNIWSSIQEKVKQRWGWVEKKRYL